MHFHQMKTFILGGNFDLTESAPNSLILLFQHEIWEEQRLMNQGNELQLSQEKAFQHWDTNSSNTLILFFLL